MWLMLLIYHANEILMNFIRFVNPSEDNRSLFFIRDISCLISNDWEPASLTWRSIFPISDIISFKTWCESSCNHDFRLFHQLYQISFCLLMAKPCLSKNCNCFSNRLNLIFMHLCSITLGACKLFSLSCASLWHEHFSHLFPVIETFFH